jgi:hypothetical protein
LERGDDCPDVEAGFSTENGVTSDQSSNGNLINQLQFHRDQEIVGLDAVVQRFEQKYSVNSFQHPRLKSPCWTWAAATDRDGYGRFKVLGRELKAHVFAWYLHIGELPTGLELHHKCRNPACVNPEHLQPVTGEEHRRLGRRTHCPNGHRYTPESTKWRDGRRICRTCERGRSRRYRARKAGREEPRMPRPTGFVLPGQGAARLQALWIALHRRHHRGRWVKPWEGAEVGIVRQIVAMIGYDAAESLLRAAVTDWDGIYFDDDAVRWPAYPSLFFIRRHLEALVNWCMREHGLEVESETPDEVAEHVGDVLVSARDLDSSEDAWQTAVAAEHGGFVAPWTVRDREKVRRMAAELITEFGDDSLPGEVLVRCAMEKMIAQSMEAMT